MIIDQEKINELKNKQPLNFEDALFLMRSQIRVYRLAWSNGYNIGLKKNMNVVGFQPYFEDQEGKRFEASTESILAEDWMVVN